MKLSCVSLQNWCISTESLTNDGEKSVGYATIVDLPIELLLMSFKDFDLGDLVKVACLHPQTHAAAEIAFKDKYQSFKIQIGESAYSLRMPPLSVYKDTIILYSSDFTLDTVRLFGQLFSKLRVDDRFLLAQKKQQIYEFIGNYCASTLEHIEFGYCEDSFFKYLQRPFKNIKSVKFSNANFTELPRLNKIFPTVRQLVVGSVCSGHLNCFPYNFPQLTDLSIDTLFLRTQLNVREMLRMNPQLKRVTVNLCNMELLRILSENVPMLEQLKIDGYTTEKVTMKVHFEHLKRFTSKRVYDYGSSGLREVPFVFTTLEEFQFPGSMDPWMDVIVQNKALKKINIQDISGEQLVRLIEELPNLEEIMTWFNIARASDDIVHFLKGVKHLRKIGFRYLEPETRREFNDRFGADWFTTQEQRQFVLARNGSLIV